MQNKEGKQKKSGPAEIKKHYVQLKSSWDKDRNAFIAMQRNFFVLLALISMGGVIVSMIVIKSMVEKNAIEPYVISVNTADKMPVAVNSQSVRNYATANPVVIEFFLIKYIKSREGYEFATYNYDYNTVAKNMSTYGVYQQFRKAVLNDDKNNPVKIFGKDGRVEVVIKQVTHMEKSQIATVRIAKKVWIGDNVRTVLNYSIKLHYTMETANLKVSDIEINPLGIIVDTYEVTEEKTIVEDETFRFWIMTKYIILIFACLLQNFVYAKKIRDIPVSVDSRIKTLVYNPNEIYTLNLKIGFQSIIEFSIDETIEVISIGEPYPWKLTPIERRLFIKPLQVGVRTNLTIITNKRVYLFDLQSDATSSSNDFDVIHVTRFFYPQVPLDQSQYSFDNYLSYKEGNTVNSAARNRGLKGETIGNTDLSNAGSGEEHIAVNLNYSFVGEYNEITPVEIFDDRKDTFFRFEKQDVRPKIYTISNTGRRKLVKQKRLGEFTVIPGVHTKFLIKDGVHQNYIYNDLKVNKKEQWELR